MYVIIVRNFSFNKKDRRQVQESQFSQESSRQKSNIRA